MSAERKVELGLFEYMVLVGIACVLLAISGHLSDIDTDLKDVAKAISAAGNCK